MQKFLESALTNKTPCDYYQDWLSYILSPLVQAGQVRAIGQCSTLRLDISFHTILYKSMISPLLITTYLEAFQKLPGAVVRTDLA